ncbi:hypothetical protein [Burkholderia anthina]|uniref:hypothetical protein n=1 Tax=Burkholderia anthina TaxID=179879 RepID=UPI001588D47E|nr:hypothetical protein [Burkholderia anthina]
MDDALAVVTCPLSDAIFTSEDAGHTIAADASPVAAYVRKNGVIEHAISSFLLALRLGRSLPGSQIGDVSSAATAAVSSGRGRVKTHGSTRLNHEAMRRRR